jgi:hypothetical protein
MLKCQEICQEILQFLVGNIAINKDENRKSSFMKVEAMVEWVVLTDLKNMADCL